MHDLQMKQHVKTHNDCHLNMHHMEIHEKIKTHVYGHQHQDNQYKHALLYVETIMAIKYQIVYVHSQNRLLHNHVEQVTLVDDILTYT